MSRDDEITTHVRPAYVDFTHDVKSWPKAPDMWDVYVRGWFDSRRAFGGNPDALDSHIGTGMAGARPLDPAWLSVVADHLGLVEDDE